MSLKLEKERVIEAAKRCKDAKTIFEILWPELFEEEEDEDEDEDEEQEYCCEDFEKLVDYEILEWDGDREYPMWIFEKTGSFVEICPFCEIVPKEPIF